MTKIFDYCRKSQLSMRTIFFSLALLISVTLVSVRADAAEVKIKKNLHEICYRCHADVRRDLKAKGRRVHAPAAEGDCTSCHGPHTSMHNSLVRYREGKLCASCHEEVKEYRATSYPHTPVVQGNCTGCHEPHSAAEPDLLTKSGAELCQTCHEELKEKTESAAVLHKPVRDGKCLGCHDPHGSEYKGNVRQPLPDLCLTCHGDKTALAEAHGGYAIHEQNCAVCHDPHGYKSTGKGLLLSYTHPPVAALNCEACHKKDESGMSTKLIAQVPRLCYGCHITEKASYESGKNIHPPVAKGECLTCHDPHASAYPKLVINTQWELCGSCHDSIEKDLEPKTVHPPFKEGSCSECHNPHASDFTGILKEYDPDVCKRCHDGDHPHSYDADIAEGFEIREGSKCKLNERGELTCISCHGAHSSEERAMAHYDPDRRLCAECHPDILETR